MLVVYRSISSCSSLLLTDVLSLFAKYQLIVFSKPSR